MIENTRQWWGYQISTNLLNIDRRPLKREFSQN
nr:MAG TPA: vacuolar protein sorting-associated protein [Caudoviricetes sp.]